MNVEKYVEHAHKLGGNETEDIQEKALAIGHLKERRLQGGTRSQLRADLCLQYRYIGNQTDEHYQTCEESMIMDRIDTPPGTPPLPSLTADYEQNARTEVIHMIATGTGRYKEDDETDHQNESSNHKDGARLGYGIWKKT